MVVFAGYSEFFHYSQLASHDVATIGINVTNNKVAYSKFQKFNVLVFLAGWVSACSEPMYYKSTPDIFPNPEE